MAEVLEITADTASVQAQPKAQTARYIRKAARLRVSGTAWKAIASGVGVTEAYARHWPVNYPDLWRTAYDKALAAHRPHIEAVAMQTVEELMSDTVRKPVVGKDGRVDSYKLEATPLQIRQSASNTALVHARQSRAQQVNVSATVAIADTTALIELARAGTFASDEQIALAETGTLPAQQSENETEKADTDSHEDCHKSPSSTADTQ